MKSLPLGYQVVAGLAIVYAILTGGCMASVYSRSPSHVMVPDSLC